MSTQRASRQSNGLSKVEEETEDQEKQLSSEDLNGHTPEVTIEILDGKGTLQRSITLYGVIAILIANVGSTSIFITPTMILQWAGSPAMCIFIWMVGGVVQALFAFCAVELTLMFQKAGGAYYFTNISFGDMAGFVYMWGFVIFIVGPSWALGSYTASLYTLLVFYPGCKPSDFLVKLGALWLMITLMAINCTYMKVVTSIQSILTSCKVLALAIIIVLGVSLAPSDSGKENLSSFLDETTTSAGNIAMALFAGSFGFGGWQVITILAEEVKDPIKNIPRGLGFSFAVLIIINMSTNFAYYVVLSKTEALKSDAVAMLFGQMIHPVVPVVMSILVSLCAIGTLNVLIMGQPRVLFAAGRNGHMPRIMTMLHTHYNTPWPATWTSGVVATCLLLTGSVMSLVSSISLYMGITTINMTLCLFKLRWTDPEKHRPFKIPIIIPIVMTLLTAAIIAMSVFNNPSALITNILVILLGIPVYLLFFKCKAVKRRLTFMDRVGHFMERAFSLQYEKRH